MSNQTDVQTLTSYIKTFTNPQLKLLLRHEGLQVSGVKAALQFRIIHRAWTPLIGSPVIPLFPILLSFASRSVKQVLGVLTLANRIAEPGRIRHCQF